MQAVPETLYHEAQMIDMGQLPKPRMAVFTPTYNCNQSCSYCFYKEWNNKGNIEPYENIPKILLQLKKLGVKSVEFEGGGDPLMTPNIEKYFKEANSLNMKIGLLTNGALFKDEIAETFLKHGNYVRFSLDTTDPEKYKKIRGTNDFQKVADNIKAALDIKKKNKYSCDISIKIGIVADTTQEDIYNTFHYFKDWGLDNIQVKNLWDDKGIEYKKDITYKKLKEIDNFMTPVVKKVVYPKYMTEQCWITPVQIAVDVHGDFYLCPYYMYRKNSFKVGNIFEKPLAELWGSKEHLDAIRNIRITECLKHNCRFQKYMRVIRNIQKTGRWEFL